MTVSQLPTKAGVPDVTEPIAQPDNDAAIAPWPAVDKTNQIVIGPGLSLAYISAVFRLSMQGYRQSYVDLLDEMLEKDPHAFSVLSKRVMGVASGKLEIVPAEVDAGSQDEKLALDIAKTVSSMVASIPAMEERLTEMAWALYFGLVGEETHWVRDGRGWMVDRLSLVHSRRLSYPVAGSWDLYIWDQGWVWGGPKLTPTSNGMFGFRVADAPGKFVIHAPQIRGGYPTRNGLGRQLAYWMALKLVASRGAPIYLERFAKPWPEGIYSTGPEKDKAVTPQNEIDKAEAALEAMGAGALSHWIHSDRMTLNLRTPDTGAASKLTFSEWIGICDSQVSKCTLGGTLGTDAGTKGARALGDTQRKSEMALYKHDAGMLASSIDRDLISWIVRLNYPSAPRHVYPHARLHVEDDPDPLAVMDKAAKGVNIGMPVDADKLAEEVGLPLVDPDDTKARRLFPIMPQKEPAQFDADLAARAAAIAEEYPAEEAETEDKPAGDAGDGEDDNADEPSDEED